MNFSYSKGICNKLRNREELTPKEIQSIELALRLTDCYESLLGESLGLDVSAGDVEGENGEFDLKHQLHRNALRLKEFREQPVPSDKRDYKVYAVDFDGTLCYSLPDMTIISPNIKLITFLIQERKEGNKVILWTCRYGDKLDEAVAFCKRNGLEFDEICKNTDKTIEHFGLDSRKIAADYYIDDKNVDCSMFNVPYFGE